MKDKDIEKLKPSVVINMHISALLFLAIALPPIFVPFFAVNPNVIVIYVAGFIVSGYNFIRHTIYLKSNQKYIKSKRRFALETLSYIFCCVLAIIIGVVPAFHKSMPLITAIKIIFGCYSFFIMCIMMGSAHRINKLCVKEMDNQSNDE